ncbi:MAG: T9SS type A sorting domain-containing protein, partial [Bacteroidia bacterium]|nr:T9SS type A sorting domain-containing protein [Bacteroidia bacterium]
EDWCTAGFGSGCLTFNLTPYVGNPNIRVRIEQKSNAGNNLFVDNIQITGTPLAPKANLYSLTKTVCVGDDVLLMDSSLNNPTSYFWEVPDAVTSIYTTKNPIVSFTSPGLKTIKLKVTNQSGSDSIEKVNYINVLPSPQVPVVSSSKGDILCDGDSTTISTDASSNFIWFKNNLQFNMTQTSFIQKEEAEFFVRVSGTNGCRIKSNLLKIETGLTPPKPTITKDLTGTAFCEGGSFNLSSSAASNNQWYVNDTIMLNQNNKVYSGNEAGTYKVKVSDKGCFAFSDELAITKLPRPVTSAISGANYAIKGDTARFSVTGGMTGSTFNWTLTSGSVQSGSGTNSVLIKFTTAATSTVNVQENASNGCKGELKSLQVNLVNTSISELENGLKLNVYPNPAKENLNIQMFDSEDDILIQVMDVLGRNIYSTTLQEASNKVFQFDINNFANGLYILHISQGEKSALVHFVKE